MQNTEKWEYLLVLKDRRAAWRHCIHRSEIIKLIMFGAGSGSVSQRYPELTTGSQEQTLFLIQSRVLPYVYVKVGKMP